MKLESVNPLESIEKYGFKYETLMYKTEDFKGHQMGTAICITIKQTNEVEKSYLENDDNMSLARAIIKDENVKLITNDITQLDDNNNRIEKTIYFMPFVPTTHTSLRPTVTNTNITDFTNAHWEGEIEILLVTPDGIKRYITMPFSTHNVSMFDLVHDAFEDDDNFVDAFANSENPMEYEYDEDEGKAGYKLKFYNDIGQGYKTHFELNTLREYIASIRLVKLKCITDTK